jgi:hypothetical protein
MLHFAYFNFKTVFGTVEYLFNQKLPILQLMQCTDIGLYGLKFTAFIRSKLAVAMVIQSCIRENLGCDTDSSDGEVSLVSLSPSTQISGYYLELSHDSFPSPTPTFFAINYSF